MPSGHEFLEHTADIQVHVWGHSMEALFKETGMVLMSIIVEGGEVRLEKQIDVTVEAEDWESLVFDWLTEFLYYFDTELFVVGDIDIHELEDREEGEENRFIIKSSLKGERYDEERHVPGTEVKAITYSYMEIWQKENQFHMKIVFDI